MLSLSIYIYIYIYIYLYIYTYALRFSTSVALVPLSQPTSSIFGNSDQMQFNSLQSTTVIDAATPTTVVIDAATPTTVEARKTKASNAESPGLSVTHSCDVVSASCDVKIYNILRGGLLLRRPPAEETVSCRGGLLLRRPPAEVETASLEPMYLVFDPTKKYIHTLSFYQRRSDEYAAGIAPSQITADAATVVYNAIAAAADAAPLPSAPPAYARVAPVVEPTQNPRLIPVTPGMDLPFPAPAAVPASPTNHVPASPETPSVATITASLRRIGVVG